MNIENIKKSLENVKYPGFSKSIIDFGFVKDIKVEDEKLYNLFRYNFYFKRC